MCKQILVRFREWNSYGQTPLLLWLLAVYVGPAQRILIQWIFRDAQRCKQVTTMGGHWTRVGTLAWSSHVLFWEIVTRASYSMSSASKTFISKFTGYKSEVTLSLNWLVFEFCEISSKVIQCCLFLKVWGLKLYYDDVKLASGGNHNQMLLWLLSVPNSAIYTYYHPPSMITCCFQLFVGANKGHPSLTPMALLLSPPWFSTQYWHCEHRVAVRAIT